MWRKRSDQDFAAEIESHLAMEAERQREAGLDQRAAAAAAQRAFGNVARSQKRFFESRRWLFWANLAREFRMAGRALRRSPVFTAVVVLTLALGMGVGVAVFSMVDALLLRPLPVAQPDQLAVLAFRQGNGPLSTQFSLPDVRDIGAQTGGVFSAVTGYMELLDGLSRGGAARSGAPSGSATVLANYVTDNFFTTLGLHAYRGRLIEPGEGRGPGSDPVLVLSYSTWQRQFGGDPGIVGATVHFNGKPITVIGVTPPRFHGTRSLADIQAYVPISMLTSYEVGWPPNLLDNRILQNAFVLARLRAGVSWAAAAAALRVVAGRLARAYPATEKGLALSAYPELLARPGPESGALLRHAAALFLALAGLVMLLACLNAANLFAVRAAARGPELAVRAALGAGRGRLARELLCESLLLGLAGGAAGLALGVLGGQAAAAIPQHTYAPLQLDIRGDGRVAAFGILAAVLAGVAVGLASAWRASGRSLDAVLRTSGRSHAGGRTRWREAFAGLQVAGSLAVLVVAFLFARSLGQLRRESLGFAPAQVVNLSLNPADAGFSQSAGEAFYRSLLPRIAALPGVQSVGLSDSTPLGDYYNNDNLKIAGYTSPPGEGLPLVDYSVVSGGYFPTLRIPLLEGRGFTAADIPGAPPVAVVNRAFARKYWPGRDPIGQHFAKVSGATNPVYEVVGVAGDVRNHSLTGPFAPYFYLPLTQNYDLSPLQVLQIRSAAPAGTVMREAEAVVRSLAPAMPVFNVETMEASLDSLSAFLAFEAAAVAAAIVGAVGMLLAVLGVYGVMSYTAALRRREIGIRLALGARPGQVLRLMLGRGAAVVACGLGAGLGLAVAAARLSANLLAGVRFTDPAAYAGAGLLLGLVSLLACALPARRAAQLDPVRTLRQE